MKNKTKKPTSIGCEIFFIIFAMIIAIAFLVMHTISPFLSIQLFIGLIVGVALCGGILIAMIIIYNKNKRHMDGDDE